MHLFDGRIDGIGSQQVILSYWDTDKQKIVRDTVISENGRFTFSLNLKEETSALLKVNNMSIQVSLQPTDMVLDLSDNEVVRYRLSKPVSAKTENSRIEEKIPAQEKSTVLQAATQKKTTDDKKHLEQPKRIRLNADSEDNQEYYKRQLDNMFYYLARLSLDTYKSDDLLGYELLLDEIPLDTIKNAFSEMPESIKSNEKGKMVSRNILRIDNSMPGAIAPDFTTNDTEDRKVQLSSYQGKYVLLNFWGGWSSTLEQEMNDLKKIYSEYFQDGLLVIGISCDRDEDRRIKAIVKNGINSWPQISWLEKNKYISNQVLNDDINEKYFIPYTLPLNILIDKDGIIIGEWRGYSDEIITQLNDVLKKVFAD